MNDTIKLQMQGYDRQICPTFKTLVQQLGISQTIMAVFQPPAQITPPGQAVPPNYIGPCCDVLCFCDDLAATTTGLVSNTSNVCGGIMPPPTPPPMPQPTGQNSGFGMPQTGFPNNNNNNNQGTVNTFGFPPNNNNQGTFSGFNNNVFPAPPTFGNNNGNSFPGNSFGQPQPTFNAQAGAGRDAWGRPTSRNSAPVVPNPWANAGRK